jgi:hypothetical protein
MSMPSKWLPSVETIQANLVFARLTRHSRRPSPRTTMRLFVAAFLVGTGDAVALLATNLVFLTDIGEVIVMSGLAVAFLSPPVAAVMTIVTTMADVQSEAYQLVRASLLPREEILLGYLYAALYRLRLLWVLALGLLPPLVAVLLAGDILLYTSADGVPVTVVLAALAVWLVSVAAGFALNWLAVCIAVWQSLRWKRVELAIAAVIVLFAGIEVLGCVALALVYWLMFNCVVQTGSVAPLICFPVFILYFVGISVRVLTNVIREKAEDCI